MSQDDGASGRTAYGLLIPDSETGRALLSMDWARSPLGPVETWPAALRTAVQLCLNSRFPMTVAWGDDLINIYNDGYLPILGSKHPGAFGQPVSEVYAEIRDFLQPRIEETLRTARLHWEENMLLPLVRRDAPEERYFTFCYSALADEGGEIRGLTAIATDTTRFVVRERRDALMRRLNDKLADSASPQDVISAIASICEAGLDLATAAVFVQSDIGEVVWGGGDAGCNTAEMTDAVLEALRRDPLARTPRDMLGGYLVTGEVDLPRDDGD